MIWGFVKFWSLWKKANTIIILRAKICVYDRTYQLYSIIFIWPGGKNSSFINDLNNSRNNAFCERSTSLFPDIFKKKVVPLLVSDLSQPCPYKLVTASDQIGFPLSIFSASARSSIARPNMLINYKLLSVEFCKFDSILNLEKFSIQPPKRLRRLL